MTVEKITFPEDLPVSAHVEEITELLKNHQVVVVAGETGSGKSTQLPKICLQAGFGVKKRIGHTQPRRLAARSVAARVAEELGVELGGLVGYQVRFHDKCTEHTQVKVMTDGVLLSEIQRDKLLKQYDVLIVDEAHERSLNIDFLLGYLKQLLPKRPDLRVVITSATIDFERFSRHFNCAPVVTVSGRTYPVDMHYMPLVNEHQEPVPLAVGVTKALDRVFQKGWGDVLIFLSTEREIHELADDLKHYDKRVEILKLYARMSLVAQQKIFHPKGGSIRVILTTNVAETSLTVPKIRYVIDAGMARISRFSYRNKVQALPIEPISQASANQRSGRCGRTGPGVCVRLYSEDDFFSRPEFTDPEILRTNLTGTILQMKKARLGPLESFPFIEPPRLKHIRAGYRLLFELGALDARQCITPIGQTIADLPIDPKFSRILYAGQKEYVLYDVLVIVSALSLQDPRERPFEQQQKADECHRQWQHPQSDFLSYLLLWETLRVEHQQLSHRKFRQFCADHFLSINRVMEWFDLFTQLKQACISKHWAVSRQQCWYKSMLERDQNPAEANIADPLYQAIHKALLTGMLGHIGQLKPEDKAYHGARQVDFKIFPGSGLAKKMPKWVMGAELVETSHRFLRQAAAIDPVWLEKLAPHLVKKAYLEPHYVAKQGGVYAFEQISLLGLVIVPRRNVYYGTIAPQECQPIFIEQAILTGKVDEAVPFVRQNQALLEQLRVQEHKLRRRDIVLDEARLAQFYQERLPVTVNSVKSAQKWWRQADKPTRQRVLLTPEEATFIEANVDALKAFPDTFEVKGLTLKATYLFDPSDELDGLTVTVPLPVLLQLDPVPFSWLIPQWLTDKAESLIRALPKPLRRRCVPAPEVARQVVAQLSADQKSQSQSFEKMLAEKLTQHCGYPISEEEWQDVLLPDYLRINFQLVNAQGKVLDNHRDLTELQEKWRERAQRAGLEQEDSAETEHLYRTWPNDLPEQCERQQLGVQYSAYPALVRVPEKGVKIGYFNDLHQAQQEHVNGVLYLLKLSLPEAMQKPEKHIVNFDKLALLYGAVGSRKQLLDDLVEQALYHAFLGDTAAWAIRTSSQFDQVLQQKKGRFISSLQYMATQSRLILEKAASIRQQLKKKQLNLQLIEPYQDIQKQLSELVYPGFILQTPLTWLERVPHYLEAILIRLERLHNNWQKDRQQFVELLPFLEATATAKLSPEKQKEYFWWLQEFRIALFAQPMKTVFPVSAKRLRAFLAE